MTRRIAATVGALLLSGCNLLSGVDDVVFGATGPTCTAVGVGGGALATCGEAGTGGACPAGEACAVGVCWPGWRATQAPAEMHIGGTFFAAAGRVYALGGGPSSGERSATIELADLQPSGELGPWRRASTPFPASVAGAAAVVVDGHVYVMGGVEGSAQNFVTTVRFAPIDPCTGELLAFETGPSFETGRSQAAAFAHGGSLYLLGGETAGNGGCAADAAVQAAAVDPGTHRPGPWHEVGALPSARWGSVAVADEGRAYLVGGITQCGAYTSDVAVAVLGEAGSSFAWTPAGTAPRTGAARVAVHGERLFIVGGDAGGHPTPEAHAARIGSSGALGPWAQTPPTPVPDPSWGSAMWGGRLYLVGQETRYRRLP